MFTTPFKVTLATIAGVAIVGALTINQVDLSHKVSLLEKTAIVATTPVPTVTTVPTATPSAAVKFTPTHLLVKPTLHVAK